MASKCSQRHFWLSPNYIVLYMIECVAVPLSKASRGILVKVSETSEMVCIQILCSGYDPESFGNLVCPLWGSASTSDVPVVTRSVELSCLLASEAIHVVMYSPPSAPHVAMEPNKCITTRKGKLPLGFWL